jgi:hypothetical protein
VVAGAVLIVAGVAVIHWPSALVVAGIIASAAGLFLDVEE